MLNHLDPESFTTRAIQFFQAALNDSEDSDLEADTDLSPKITKENIVIKENKPANEVTIQLSLIKKKETFSKALGHGLVHFILLKVNLLIVMKILLRLVKISRTNLRWLKTIVKNIILYMLFYGNW